MDRIRDPLALVGEVDPSRPFAITSSWVVTYGEADRRVQFVSEALRRMGLGPGDRLALHRPGGARDPQEVFRDILILLAGWRCGLTMVPLSGRLPHATVPELLKAIGVANTIGEDGIAEETVLGGMADVGAVPTWALDAPATIVFTSGTTGEPKGALHTMGNHVWSARGWNERLPLAPEDRWLLDLPLYHVGGLAVLFRCVMVGAAVAIPDRSVPLAESVTRLGATRISLVSTQMHRALRDAVPLDRLSLVLLGGSMIGEDMLHEALQRGWPVCTSYGLTEMASTVAASLPGADTAAMQTAGSVLPYREIRLADDGEVMVRGRTRFAGYVTSDGVNKPFDREGWFATSDLAEWVDTSSGSMLRILGRKDNLFISGGENIQPEAIEAIVLRQPGVRQAVVVAAPSAEYGERPVAFVEAAEWEPEAWGAAVAVELPKFMVPESFHPWPANPNGEDAKPSRAELARIAGEI